MRIRLRYPASPGNASDHAQIAVDLAREEYDAALDFSPESLDLVDSLVESLREEGLDGEGAAETLFVLGCYLGEVMVRRLGGAWVPTSRSSLRGRVAVAHGGGARRRLGLGHDREGVQAARARGHRVPARVLRGGGQGRARGPVSAADEPDDELPPGDRPFEIPLTGDLDLHPFSPREIPSVVEEYVRACRERGVLRLRLAHGRGKGVQRAAVRRVLASIPEVVSFSDAPPSAGGWGATVVLLRGNETSSVL